MFINEAYAATQPVAASGSVSGMIIQLGLILLIFYLFLIRPQQKKIKEHSDMVQALKVGDKVITNGGIYGKVAKLEDSEISLEVASGVVIRVERMSIGGVIVSDAKKSAEKADKKSADKSKKTTKKEKK